MDEHDNERFEIQHVMLTSTVYMDAPPPPPPLTFVSPFKTLQEWLENICDTEDPGMPIDDLQFSFSQSPARIMLTLVGFKTDIIDGNTKAHRLVFIPASGDFPLPYSLYPHLFLQELRERVLSEILEFSKTEKFKGSFLWQAASIRINFIEGPSVILK